MAELTTALLREAIDVAKAGFPDEQADDVLIRIHRAMNADSAVRNYDGITSPEWHEFSEAWRQEVSEPNDRLARLLAEGRL